MLGVTIFINSCRESSEIFAQKIVVNGKIINNANGEPVTNYLLHLVEQKTASTGILGVTVIENEVATTTDVAGNFSFTFQVKHRNDDFRLSGKGNADYDTFSEFVDFGDLGTPKIFKVSNFEKLEIYLKNVLPETHESDKIKVYIYQKPEYGTVITSIENFGLANQPFGNSSYENGLNPYWIGKNINSVIRAKLISGSHYQIFYDITKNGVTKFNQHSEIFETQSGVTNIFSLNF